MGEKMSINRHDNIQMSRSRISGERHQSRSKSFLNAPIEFRRVVHNRRGHEAISGYPQPSKISRHRQLLPSQSHLERLVHPGGGSSGMRSGLAKQLSLSHSEASRLHNHTPNSQIVTPKNFQSNGNPSRLDTQLRDHTSLKNFINPRHSEPQQQRSPMRQQRAQTEVSAEQINEKLNRLVHRKLQAIFESFQKRGNARGQAEAQKELINRQLQRLIEEIKCLRGYRGEEMDLYNQKITFIETLLAEQLTEAELMKKHYFHMSSNKKKGGNFQLFKSKVSAAYQSLSTYQNQSKQYRSVGSPLGSGKKPLFKETTNKSSYKQPRKSDYQSYRYQCRPSPPNLQPLPRSSYKRDFQPLPSNHDEKIINRDHSPYNPQHRQRVGSIYGQDYRAVSTEMVDPRSQDACKDKIKTINVSYIPEKRQLPQPLQVPPKRRQPLHSPNFASDQELNHRKRTLLSESKREYTGLKTFQPSQIKHRQLHEFQYKLKNLFKA